MEKKCPVCGKPLITTSVALEKECCFCHQKFMVKAACENEHYICRDCFAKQGIEAIKTIALQSQSSNPVEIAVAMMQNPYIHFHGKEHHVLVGAALLSAYRNSGGNLDLEQALSEVGRRGAQVPVGVCSLWGACGAGISAGIFISIVTGTTSQKETEWSLSNLMTSKALEQIATLGGPHCCKRNSFLAIQMAVNFCANHLGIQMNLSKNYTCTFKDFNPQCVKDRCPFF